MWKSGETANIAFIIHSGYVNLQIKGDKESATFGPGAFIGDLDALLYDENLGRNNYIYIVLFPNKQTKTILCLSL